MACPFFCPADRAHDIALPHPARLPLGAAWRGSCQAPGHEESLPNEQELESCNLGYAKSCHRLPAQRTCDAVRFAVASDSGSRVLVQFVLETAHLPSRHGFIDYDRMLGSWTSRDSEPGIQKMAECFLQSYLERKGQ